MSWLLKLPNIIIFFKTWEEHSLPQQIYSPLFPILLVAQGSWPRWTSSTALLFSSGNQLSFVSESPVGDQNMCGRSMSGGSFLQHNLSISLSQTHTYILGNYPIWRSQLFPGGTLTDSSPKSLCQNCLTMEFGTLKHLFLLDNLQFLNS